MPVSILEPTPRGSENKIDGPCAWTAVPTKNYLFLQIRQEKNTKILIKIVINAC